jgi:hypothetical protein
MVVPPADRRSPDGGRMTLAAVLVADRYEVQDPIGRGGMAVVHRGWDRRLDRPVAIKVFRADSGAREVSRRRSETRLLASLHHPSLVTLFDAVSAEDATYLVMELVEGPTLRQWLQRSVLSPDVAAVLAGSLAEGLHFIHERGVVHRDVKPANVLLAPSPIPGRPPTAKLSDFGIARLVESDRVTSTGTFVGTAQYLSPEQARGEPVGPPSDVYSLGLLLLEAITGVTAFPGSPIESATARLARDPHVPGTLGYGWKSLLTGMTQRNPAARPTALDVVLRAQAMLQGELEEAPTEVDHPLPRTGPTGRRAAVRPPEAAEGPAPASAPLADRTARAVPAAAPAPLAPGPTRAFPVDEPFPVAGPATASNPFDATTVLPVAVPPEPRPAEVLRQRAVVLLDRLLAHPVSRAVLAWLRAHPLIGLGLAAVAAVLVAVVLVVALMPGSPAPAAAPVLPATGQPLREHLQQLLESVSR